MEGEGKRQAALTRNVGIKRRVAIGAAATVEAVSPAQRKGGEGTVLRVREGGGGEE